MTAQLPPRCNSGKSVCLEHEGVHICFQGWMTAQPPPRGNYFLSRPRVHRGFQATFASNGLDARLVEFLGGLLTEHDMVSANVDVLVTGAGIDRDARLVEFLGGLLDRGSASPSDIDVLATGAGVDRRPGGVHVA
jgi:hypothetical protein